MKAMPREWHKIARKASPFLKEASNIDLQNIWDDLSRTILGFLERHHDRHTFIFSSARAGEGTSTLALHTAAAVREFHNNRVVLVDGDLRQPALHERLGISKENGLVEVMEGKITLEEAMVEEGSRGFFFLPAGRPCENPLGLLKSEAFVGLVHNLSRLFEVVIFDSAPINPYPETPLMASVMDGLILVVLSEKTKWEVARAAMGKLERVQVNILGAILNRKKYYIPPSIYQRL